VQQKNNGNRGLNNRLLSPIPESPRGANTPIPESPRGSQTQTPILESHIKAQFHEEQFVSDEFRDQEFNQRRLNSTESGADDDFEMRLDFLKFSEPVLLSDIIHQGQDYLLEGQNPISDETQNDDQEHANSGFSSPIHRIVFKAVKNNIDNAVGSGEGNSADDYQQPIVVSSAPLGTFSHQSVEIKEDKTEPEIEDKTEPEIEDEIVETKEDKIVEMKEDEIELDEVKTTTKVLANDTQVCNEEEVCLEIPESIIKNSPRNLVDKNSDIPSNSCFRPLFKALASNCCRIIP